MWKETLAILAGSLAAMHAMVTVVLSSQDLYWDSISQVEYVELILLSGIPSVVHLLTGHRKYEGKITK